MLQVKQSQLDREQVAREIAEKLGRSPGVSYTEIAKKAADFGRTQLAIKVYLKTALFFIYNYYVIDINIQYILQLYK